MSVTVYCTPSTPADKLHMHRKAVMWECQTLEWLQLDCRRSWRLTSTSCACAWAPSGLRFRSNLVSLAQSEQPSQAARLAGPSYSVALMRPLSSSRALHFDHISTACCMVPAVPAQLSADVQEE
jgi:hypothetical protein